MESDPESVCCSEIPKVQAKMELEEGTSCITNHPFFDPVCLNVFVLQTAYLQYRQEHGNGFENVYENE